MTTHWAEKYIGRPWTKEDNCGMFFVQVQREQFGRTVHPVDADALHALSCAHAIDAQVKSGDWPEVKTPKEGDAVVIGKGKRATHIGIWIEADGGKVLHCGRGIDGVAQCPTALKGQGWNIIGYHRMAEQC